MDKIDHQRESRTMTQAIELHSFATPNGMKIGIALEEMGLAYTPHRIDITRGEQNLPEFVALSPYSKIPAIHDPEGPCGRPVVLAESCAILIYLADKSGQFMPTEIDQRMETIQWLFFQAAGVGPMFGQFGHFHKYAGDQCDHPYPIARYTGEVRRLLAVIERRLADRSFIMGDEYGVADMSLVAWVDCLSTFYAAAEVIKIRDFPAVLRWLDVVLARPAVQRGMRVCAPDD
jgi:glutathione S-transferase